MRSEVRDTADLRRVVALPRRLPTVEDARERARLLTPMLALRSDVSLRPWQGFGLWEAIECRGAFYGFPVGLGKTLMTWLLPTCLDSSNSLLLTSASLRNQTYETFRGYLGSWRAPDPAPHVISFEELTQESNLDLLFRISPDLIMIDEADTLRNQEASAVRRLARYIGEHEPMVVAMTGTPGRNSILDYSHLLIWSLKEGAPIPLSPSEAEVWAAVIDEKPKFRAAAVRPRAGALALLGGSGAPKDVRSAYRDRLTQTPGVVIVDGDSCDQPLTVRQVLPPEDAEIDRHFKRFREEQESPDGWPVSDPLSEYRFEGQIGTGLYLKWDPRPPEEWIQARRAVCKLVRDTILASNTSNRPLDTEAMVFRAYADHPLVTAWRAIRDTFTPNTVPVWVSPSVLNAAKAWIDREPDSGIVWCGNVEFGRALATITGLPFFGAKGETEDGRYIARETGERSIIASIGANLRGRNLQAWSRNLVINPPQSARYLEQLIGRTHRSGQDYPVLVEIMCTSGGVLDAFDSAWREANFGADTIGIRQKLLRATIERATPQITRSNVYRWGLAEAA